MSATKSCEQPNVLSKITHPFSGSWKTVLNKLILSTACFLLIFDNGSSLFCRTAITQYKLFIREIKCMVIFKYFCLLENKVKHTFRQLKSDCTRPLLCSSQADIVCSSESSPSSSLNADSISCFQSDSSSVGCKNIQIPVLPICQ